MFNNMCRWLKNNLPFLFEEKMPVWLTLCASLAAAGLTYFLAPTYNRQFQIEDVRSAHLTKTTDSLNADIIELSLKVRRFRTAYASGAINTPELREECLDLVTKLQWKLVDLRVLLTNPADEKLGGQLSNALRQLQLALDAPDSEGYSEGLAKAMTSVADATKNVLNRLYDKASLKS